MIVLQSMRHAEVDEARLFTTRNNLDGMAERRLGLHDESFGATSVAQCVGTHNPDVVAVQVRESLSKALQTVDGACDDRFRKAVVIVQSVCDAHHLADFVDNLNTTVDLLGDDQVKTIGTEV